MNAKIDTKKSAKKSNEGFTAEEKAAIKARAQELKAEAYANKGKAEGERAVLEAIAKMPALYRAMGERLHEIIIASVPTLLPKTWYGLPAYAKDGKVVCYLRMNPKPPYNDRYMTFGFNEVANLDDDNMWATGFALVELTDVEEAKVSALVKQAVS